MQNLFVYTKSTLNPEEPGKQSMDLAKRNEDSVDHEGKRRVRFR
jgi:hypothetical protein